MKTATLGLWVSATGSKKMEPKTENISLKDIRKDVSVLMAEMMIGKNGCID